jgi:hypothetical protein
MGIVWKATSVTGHVLLVVAAVVAAQAATSHLTYPPLRHAMVTLVAVLSAISLFGRLPFGLGPVAGSFAARATRMVGTVLAGIGAAGAIFGFVTGGLPTQRASGGVQCTVMLALYLAAFLAATRRDIALAPRVLLTSVGLGLFAAALFAAAVPVLPAGLIAVAFLLIGAAVVAAARLAPDDNRFLAGLLAVVTACQALFYAAAVLYHYGPDAWMPYAGPGPLTPQGQLEQNRAEAIDPYIGLAYLGALAAVILIGTVLTARLRTQAEASRAAAAVT